ncbi:MAG: phosphoribosyl-ATP diphosphatase [Duodenibacillus sp.]
MTMPAEDVSGVLSQVADVIESRRGADPGTSYVAKLFSKAPDGVLKKIGEEAVECVMAAKDENKKDIIYETADLWFHSLVMLAQYGLRPEHVLAELQRREGLSGIAEKLSRTH